MHFYVVIRLISLNKTQHKQTLSINSKWGFIPLIFVFWLMIGQSDSEE